MHFHIEWFMRKEARWKNYSLPEHTPEGAAVRAEAIVRLFLGELDNRIPVQQVIGF